MELRDSKNEDEEGAEIEKKSAETGPAKRKP